MTICLDNVTYAYKSDSVLQDVALTIMPGQFVGVVGPNGSGKTTLARLINGSLQPDSGKISVGGLFTHVKAHLFEIRRRVAIVAADAENQIVTSTVEDEIAFTLQALKLSKDEIKRQCETIVEKFNLDQFRERHPFDLSVGEQFRVLLAANLVRRPSYLILDEATSMMDSHTRQELLESLHALRRSQQMTVILLTQRLEDVLEASRIIVLQNGQTKADGSVTNIFERAAREPSWLIDPPPLYRLYGLLPMETRSHFPELFHALPEKLRLT